jgi:hypothetical protein
MTLVPELLTFASEYEFVIVPALRAARPPAVTPLRLPPLTVPLELTLLMVPVLVPARMATF